MKQPLLLSSLYRWGNWGSGRVEWFARRHTQASGVQRNSFHCDTASLGQFPEGPLLGHRPYRYVLWLMLPQCPWQVFGALALMLLAGCVRECVWPHSMLQWVLANADCAVPASGRWHPGMVFGLFLGVGKRLFLCSHVGKGCSCFSACFLSFLICLFGTLVFPLPAVLGTLYILHWLAPFSSFEFQKNFPLVIYLSPWHFFFLLPQRSFFYGFLMPFVIYRKCC